MAKIVWQTRSKRLFDSVQAGTLDRRANGGNAYDFHAIQAIDKLFNISLDPAAVRSGEEGAFHYAWRMRKHQPAGDVVVKEPSLVALTPTARAPVEVAVVHHVDYPLMRKTLKHRWFFKQLRSRLPHLDVAVTVSKFWKNELVKLGCGRVHVIYNSFDLQEFCLSDREVSTFLERYNIPVDKPLVYAGNMGKDKGGEQVYEALRDEGYTLVMTGGVAPDPSLPVKQLNLSRKDYLCLLKACDIVICMSRLLEGWNRVAHEAMLCRTPAIGSGTGGMRELLEEGGQCVVTEADKLPQVVRQALRNKGELGHRGYNFVKRFDGQYFERAWISLVRELISKG